MYEAGISVGPSNFLGDLGDLGGSRPWLHRRQIIFNSPVIMPGVYFTLLFQHKIFNEHAAVDFWQARSALIV